MSTSSVCIKFNLSVRLLDFTKINLFFFPFKFSPSASEVLHNHLFILVSSVLMCKAGECVYVKTGVYLCPSVGYAYCILNPVEFISAHT